ncbi:MAG: aldose epimerase family protein [Elusimicrobiota bacterium]
MTTKTKIKTAPFGITPDGEPVELYTLTNNSGMQLSLSSYGATITRLLVSDRDGKIDDVALGFDSLSSYLTSKIYLGCTVGRFANRIAQGRFTLDGKTYHLARNDGTNSLHGGLKGFDKRVWKARVMPGQASVSFSLRSPDGEEGYPGNLDASVTFTLTDNNEVRISYQAKTDRATVVSLTNHTYFNLAGAGYGDILNHMLCVRANRYTPADERLIPTGKILPVAGSALDFRKPAPVGARLREAGGDPAGYDHNFVLKASASGKPSLAATLIEPGSGRVMKVFTNQPGMQFYSGNFLDGTAVGKGAKPYQRHAGLCLETQRFPDAPNQRQFPSAVLRPGKTYRTTTIFKFSSLPKAKNTKNKRRND